MNVTKAEPLTREKFLELFSADVRDRIAGNIDKPDVLGIVCFDNIAFDSSQFGARSALIYGPGCTYKDLDTILAGHLGDVPSRFQYPTYYYVKPEVAP